METCEVQTQNNFVIIWMTVAIVIIILLLLIKYRYKKKKSDYKDLVKKGIIKIQIEPSNEIIRPTTIERDPIRRVEMPLYQI